ncbi:MAG: hypothetical protein ACHQJ6_03995 [Candidatus Berkiellales bacterium]
MEGKKMDNKDLYTQIGAYITEGNETVKVDLLEKISKLSAAEVGNILNLFWEGKELPVQKMTREQVARRREIQESLGRQKEEKVKEGPPSRPTRAPSVVPLREKSAQEGSGVVPEEKTVKPPLPKTLPKLPPKGKKQ